MERFFTTEMSETDKMKHMLRSALNGIKEEFDDHLESINDNTNEIHANYEYISRIETQMRTISQRLARIEGLIGKMAGVDVNVETTTKIKLTEKEKKIFLMLYTSEKTEITYEQLAQNVQEEETLVKGYITNIIEKGVPILKNYRGKVVYLSVDSQFKVEQAKYNNLGIDQRTFKDFSQNDL